MSLGLFQNRDAATYFSSGNFTQPAVEVWPAPGHLYLDKLGLVQSRYRPNGSSVPVGSCRWDPLLVNNTGANIIALAEANTVFKIGDFQPNTGAQRLFSRQQVANSQFDERSYTSPGLVIGTDVWPNVGHDQPRNAGPVNPADEGFYDITSSFNSWVFFPEWGFAVIGSATIRQGGVTYTEVMGLVDLSTGKATIIDSPISYSTNPVNQFQAGELFGESLVRFDTYQFLPDDNSTNLAPKGRLFMCSERRLPGGNTARNYIKFIDWNPLSVSGTPNRIHLRERLITRLEYEENDTGGPPPDNGVPDNLENRFLFNPRTNRVIAPFMEIVLPAAAPSAWEITVIEYLNQAEVAVITNPAPRTNPTTNRIVIFGTEARGDLNELIAGQGVTWALEAVSTQAEVLPTTPTPGETVQVANGPIDRNASFPFVVYEDGTPLTEGVHYTQTAPDNINFIGPKPLAGGEVYTCDYAHPATPTTPPIGQLLNVSGITDENGEAFTRVKYEDDDADVGFVDKLTVDTV